MDDAHLLKLSYQCLMDLATEEGINASGKDEVFGCIFGRDSALTILKILRVYEKYPQPELLAICKTTLLTLIALQGTTVNIESGEEPGKFIHEFRKDKYNHLVIRENPWFLYPDKMLRNYDSIDSTPLILIAIYKYWQLTQDHKFLITALSSVEAGLNWLITYGDMDKDSLIEYHFHPARKYGGLKVQSWTDSVESLLQSDGNFPKYPLAPIEVQGYAWLAFRLWADYYAEGHPTFSRKLSNQSELMKKQFNQKFIFKDSENRYFGVQALDGDKQQIKTITGNPLLLLWSSYKTPSGIESIVGEEYIIDFANRAFEDDMFDEYAGIRTMSTKSATFNPNQDSYHNGSFWPILNGLIYEGLINWNFIDLAQRLKSASLLPIKYFQTPIELYSKGSDGKYYEYVSSSGQVSCKFQAWSAASTLDLLV